MSALKLALLATALPFLVLGAQKRATSETFQLYAYGEGIGGPTLFYADGYAYVGDPNLSNSTDAAAVIFSTGTDRTWLGSPNTTNTTHTPSWSNVTMFVPAAGSSDMRVGFLDSGNSSDSTHITTGFSFYGNTAILIGTDGSLETMWTALETGAGVYALYWNETASGQVPVTLRRVAPSSPASRRR